MARMKNHLYGIFLSTFTGRVSIQPEDKDKWVHWKAWMIEGQLKRKLDALIYGEE
jgi:hypothetical protein